VKIISWHDIRYEVEWWDNRVIIHYLMFHVPADEESIPELYRMCRMYFKAEWYGSINLQEFIESIDV
jgi:hypothetical protein